MTPQNAQQPRVMRNDLVAKSPFPLGLALILGESRY